MEHDGPKRDRAYFETHPDEVWYRRNTYEGEFPGVDVPNGIVVFRLPGPVGFRARVGITAGSTLSSPCMGCMNDIRVPDTVGTTGVWQRSDSDQFIYLLCSRCWAETNTNDQAVAQRVEDNINAKDAQGLIRWVKGPKSTKH